VSNEWRWRLFEATGVELEYMIVDRETLAVRPIADRVLEAVGGTGEVEVELDEMAWSNELALHVVEIKTNGPAASLGGLAAGFVDSVNRIDAILDEHHARLMPTAMHPFMDPYDELRLWPHEAGPIYQAFHRIFDCRGHGWANLQSAHVNLPFGSDEEFGRLHAATRMLLPVMPALAASSPVADGRLTGLMDTRMEHYRQNSRRIQSVAGRIVPERVFTRADYEQTLLGRIYDDLAPHDPEGILRHEWANARGCIARFDRGAIEIRVIDLQECPSADLAVCAAVVSAVRGAVEGRLGDPDEHRRWHEHPLAEILVDVVRDADVAVIRDRDYLRSLGYPERTADGKDLWHHLLECTLARESGDEQWQEPLGMILDQGCLARRIARGLGRGFEHDKLVSVYRELCDCLAADRMFRVTG